MCGWLHSLRARGGIACVRRYSSFNDALSETVRVPRGPTGSITLDIIHSLQGPYRRLLLYLPRGPLLESTEDESTRFATLASSANAIVVKINYRLSAHFQYPNPIHDVLAGYDWVLEHLVASQRDANRGTEPARLGVCGELVGGSLATALALTECRMGQSRIAAAATNNAITDWLFPMHAAKAPGTSKPRKTAKVGMDDYWATEADGSRTITAALLNQLRTRSFARPAHYFDPFASPILFLRTAGVNVPTPEASLNDEFASLLGLWDDQSSKDRSFEEAVEEAEKPRKVSRKWPATGLSLRLPKMHITVGENCILRGSADEMARRLRAVALKEKMGELSDKWLDDVEADETAESNAKATAMRAAERKIEFHLEHGEGLWSGGNDERPGDMTQIGRWFSRVLR